MVIEQYTNSVQLKVVYWLFGEYCDAIPSIPVDMIQYLDTIDMYLEDVDPITTCTINLLENL